MIVRAVAPLFVPATRPELVAKASRSGADAIILDFEDAVAPDQKAAARLALGSIASMPDAVRINDVRTEWFRDDVAAVAAAGVAAVILPKTESADELRQLAALLPKRTQLVALVETVRGLARANEIAEACDRLAFGSLDYALEIGCAPEPEPLLLARAQLVAAAALAGRPAPLDGVTANFRDLSLCAADTAHAVRMGFGGRLCIHPSQVAVVKAGFRPTDEEVDWARRIEGAGPGVHNIDGVMVDGPVLKRARRVLDRLAAVDRTPLHDTQTR